MPFNYNKLIYKSCASSSGSVSNSTRVKQILPENIAFLKQLGFKVNEEYGRHPEH